MRIGIIGFGSLGRALAEGLIKAGVSMPEELYVCEKDKQRSVATGEKYGVCAFDGPEELVKACNIIFLTVKSYVFDEIHKRIDKNMLTGKTVVSFMAGVTLERLREQLGEGTKIVRGMPSLAIAQCDGVTGYTEAPDDVAEILGKLGYAFCTSPEDIEKVMAFSSCGLGFAAYLIDAFVKAGKDMGFSDEECEKIAAQTFRNALERGNYELTIGKVATKGGATEQGILHMDRCGVKQAVSQAVLKAYQRMV